LRWVGFWPVVCPLEDVLRKRFIFALAPPVLLLTLTAVVAIFALQSFLESLHNLDARSWMCIEQVNNLSVALASLEREMLELRPQTTRIVEAGRAVQRRYDDYTVCYESHLVEHSPVFAAANQTFGGLMGQIEKLSKNSDLDAATQSQLLESTSKLQEQLVGVSQEVGVGAQAERNGYISRFRILVFCLAGVFVLVINLSVLALLRTAGMIIRPMDKLIESTRELQHEGADHHVDLETKDEFGELARTYNSLVSQLASSEQHELDTLQRVALTLNHELNNALATIELQLELLGRKAGTVESAQKFTRQIREGLARMRTTVDSLKNVRRIVLTDYVAGVKMLDLEQSVQAEKISAVKPTNLVVS